MPITSIFETWHVKGIRRKILKPILKLEPDWYEMEGYFCIPGSRYFLHGFMMDHKPSGSEINMFLQPLFAHELSFSLSYAESLPRDDKYINIKKKNPTLVANEFISKVSPYIDEIVSKDSLDYFVRRIEKHSMFRNTRIAYDYSLALVLLERYSEAKMNLTEVANSEWEWKVVPSEAQSAKKLIELLGNDNDSARTLVENYLKKNKQKLGKL